MAGEGTRESPWQLKTPPGSSEYEMYRDEENETIVCVVGKTTLGYRLRAVDDLHVMLRQHGDWMPLGAADEQKPAAEGSVEAWARAEDNPVGGWYGTKKGLRGRFGFLPAAVLHGYARRYGTRTLDLLGGGVEPESGAIERLSFVQVRNVDIDQKAHRRTRGRVRRRQEHEPCWRASAGGLTFTFGSCAPRKGDRGGNSQGRAN